MIHIYQNNIVVGTQTQMISVVSKVFPSTLPPKKCFAWYRLIGFTNFKVINQSRVSMFPLTQRWVGPGNGPNIPWDILLVP